jgi:hypothetical protein
MWITYFETNCPMNFPYSTPRGMNWFATFFFSGSDSYMTRHDTTRHGGVTTRHKADISHHGTNTHWEHTCFLRERDAFDAQCTQGEHTT